jgi:FKBP-type peptidyl-prolyl cis-trans isomerase 2
MKKACRGDNVKVHYKGSFDDGSIFDSSLDCDPLEFKIGGGQVILGFEDAVVGMQVGETKTSRITTDNAYGAHLEEMVVVFERDQLPKDFQPCVGQRLQFRRDDGQVIEVTVTGVSDTSVTFDGNHPLAGKDLIFEIQLLGIS